MPRATDIRGSAACSTSTSERRDDHVGRLVEYYGLGVAGRGSDVKRRRRTRGSSRTDQTTSEELARAQPHLRHHRPQRKRNRRTDSILAARRLPTGATIGGAAPRHRTVEVGCNWKFTTFGLERNVTSCSVTTYPSCFPRPLSGSTTHTHWASSNRAAAERGSICHRPRTFFVHRPSDLGSDEEQLRFAGGSRQGGDIRVGNMPGQGSVFLIDVPLSAEAVTPVIPPAP
jgi:hypothetical protein